MSDQAAIHPPEVKAQGGPVNSGLLWNLVSTALLAGWLALRMGWVWALAGVVGVFVHEYGHVLAMNALGSGPARVRIVPFLGGAAIPRFPPATEFKGVLIALAGPVFGLVAMAPFLLAYAATGDRVWLGGAFFIAVINLLNLAPAPPLDGSKALGPALARIHPWLERAALVLVGAAAVLWAMNRGSYILAIFVGLGVFGVLRRPAVRPFALRLTRGQWLLSLALYAGALLLCFAAVQLTVRSSGFDALLRLFGRPETP